MGDQSRAMCTWMTRILNTVEFVEYRPLYRRLVKPDVIAKRKFKQFADVLERTLRQKHKRKMHVRIRSSKSARIERLVSILSANVSEWMLTVRSIRNKLLDSFETRWFVNTCMLGGRCRGMTISNVHANCEFEDAWIMNCTQCILPDQEDSDSDSDSSSDSEQVPQPNAEEVARCYVCRKTNVMRCSQCKAAFYCSREHQVRDWARHSKECLPYKP